MNKNVRICLNKDEELAKQSAERNRCINCKVFKRARLFFPVKSIRACGKDCVNCLFLKLTLMNQSAYLLILRRDADAGYAMFDMIRFINAPVYYWNGINCKCRFDSFACGTQRKTFCIAKQSLPYSPADEWYARCYYRN